MESFSPVSTFQSEKRNWFFLLFWNLISLIFVGKSGLTEIPVGVIAVFDGHNGAEASEMASKILLEYFVVHTYFLLDATYSGIFKRSVKTFSNERDHGTIFNQLSWNEEISKRGLELGRCFRS